MILLVPAPAGFAGAPTSQELAWRSPPCDLPEGRYAVLAPPLAGVPALFSAGMDGDVRLAVLIPLDQACPQRIEAARRIHRALNGEPASAPDPFTPYQRHQLRLALRALDAHRTGAAYRAIAGGLFGADRVPAGRAWKTHDLKSRTVRLVQDGLALMTGGYLGLLHRPVARS